MEIILCQCDWGLGPVPPHWHQQLTLVARGDDPGHRFWIPGFIPQPGFMVIHEVEEIHFSVPWKDLYRAVS